jgi:hypothetical protein
VRASPTRQTLQPEATGAVMSEIVDGHGIDCLAKRLDPAADCSSQVAMRVVIGYILLSWHGPP